ncbi:MAG TPA: hypothetical protein VFD01_20900 [Candidatus Dormibacteraeota bacterium]|nr:hypothetical protein [Candidatus Dormibacteraeota bacterium]
MATPADPIRRPTVVAATRVEARAARRALGEAAEVLEAGVALSRIRLGDAALPPAGLLVPPSTWEGVVVTCGVAGALRPLPAGTVLVPERVGRSDGSTLACDPELVAALVAAAHRLGLAPERGPLLTADHLVVGEERRRWAERGYVAVDMETGLVPARRLAAVRVVLDGPDRELDPAWHRARWPPARPSALRQLPWLAREGPRCARRAAAVLAEALVGPVPGSRSPSPVSGAG